MADFLTDDMDFASYYKETEASANVLPASSFRQALKDSIRIHHDKPKVFLPWEKVNPYFQFRKGEVTIWAGMNGHGKALPLTEKIPTPSGWTTIGEITPGDVVFDENGNPCNVVAMTDIMYGRPCYKLTFDDGTSIIADEQHEWLTDCSKSRNSARTALANEIKRNGSKRTNDQSHKMLRPKIRTTKEISETLVVSGMAHSGTTNHSIKVAGVLNTPNAMLPIDPYCLGAWIGDGNSDASIMTSADEFIIDQFRNAGFDVANLNSSKYRYGIRNGLHKALKENGLLKNKHIPNVYLRSSFDQRISIIQGLMDTDGHVTDYGRCEFTTIKKHIADSMFELLISCGIKAKIISGRAMLKSKDCGEKFRITFTTNINVFRLPRKLKFIKQKCSPITKNRYIISCEKVDSVPVKCIEVDSNSHLFLASESMVPTHNSQVTDQVKLSLMGQDQKVGNASFEMKPVTNLRRMSRMNMGTNPFNDAYNNPDGLSIVDQMFDEFMDWTDGRLWMYNQTGQTDGNKVRGFVKYCANELKLDHIFVDNLAKCIRNEDDYNEQKAFIEAMCAISHDTQTHIHIVHHLKKPKGGECEQPDKSDIKGTGAITDQPDNIMLVWRNKPKEEDRKKGENKKADEPDCVIYCRKQRNYEGDEENEPTIALWHHRESLQFLAHASDQPMFFQNYPHRNTMY